MKKFLLMVVAVFMFSCEAAPTAPNIVFETVEPAEDLRDCLGYTARASATFINDLEYYIILNGTVTNFCDEVFKGPYSVMYLYKKDLSNGYTSEEHEWEGIVTLKDVDYNYYRDIPWEIATMLEPHVSYRTYIASELFNFDDLDYRQYSANMTVRFR